MQGCTTTDIEDTDDDGDDDDDVLETLKELGGIH